MPFLNYKPLKLHLRVFLASNAVAMVTYCVTKMVTTCSAMVGQSLEVACGLFMCVFVFIGSEILFPVHFDWPIVHFWKISDAQLIRGCFSFSQPLRTGVFFHFSPPPPHRLFPNQYGGEFKDGGEFTIASSKTPALQANNGSKQLPALLLNLK